MPAQVPSNGRDWLQLFNGQNLDGWTAKIAGHDLGDNYGDTFRVRGGLLAVSYDQYTSFGDRFGHLFYRSTYSHYRIAVEYRFVGEQARGGPAWALRAPHPPWQPGGGEAPPAPDRWRGPSRRPPRWRLPASR